MTSVQNNNWQQALVGNTDLHRAQDAAIRAIDSYFFPKYTEAYIESFEGTERTALRIYSRAYTIISTLSNGICFSVQFIAVGIFNGQDYLIGWVTRPLARLSYDYVFCHAVSIYNTVYPINEINGKRHFVVSRSLERFLGDWFFYPQATAKYSRTYERIDVEQTIEQKVNQVVETLKQSNRDLLKCEIEGENPSEGETRFNYRALTVGSNQLNAFAVPGGGMVVFTRIVRELRDSIGAITETEITLADGSKVKVDLRGITLDDALAALLGHEMTHIASRHSFAGILSQFFISTLLSIGKFVITAYLTASHRGNFSKEEREQYESDLNNLLSFLQEKIEGLAALFHSRRCEYEADTTGAFFAREAGYNPLGALYLQEFLSSFHENYYTDFLHRYFEFAYTHPWGQNRKRALLASIEQFAPETLENGVMHTFTPSTAGYDYDNSSTAVQYGRHLSLRMGNNS